MKYAIEIWRYHSVEETYESNDIKDVLKWYKDNWQTAFDYGMCTFYVFKNNKELTFEECNKLGFYEL